MIQIKKKVVAAKVWEEDNVEEEAEEEEEDKVEEDIMIRKIRILKSKVPIILVETMSILTFLISNI